MMRQKLALVVLALPSRSLKRMNGFSPVRITRFGSAVLIADVPPVGMTVLQSRCRRHRRSSRRDPPTSRYPHRFECLLMDEQVHLGTCSSRMVFTRSGNAER